MSILIEKNVPLVPRGGSNGASAVIREMEVGDSFVIPKNKRASMSPLLARHAPKKFATRAVSEGEIRVWRTA